MRADELRSFSIFDGLTDDQLAEIVRQYGSLQKMVDEVVNGRAFSRID